MTVLQAFLTIKDPIFRKEVWDNLDVRYLSEEVKTLSYALTFGVLVGNDRSRWETITDYIRTNLHETGNEIPLHKHDCQSCIYLGTFGEDDLYYHPGQRPTLIARYGIDGNYASGLIFGEAEQNDMNSSLGEAYRRSKTLGLKL